MRTPDDRSVRYFHLEDWLPAATPGSSTVQERPGGLVVLPTLGTVEVTDASHGGVHLISAAQVMPKLGAELLWHREAARRGHCEDCDGRWHGIPAVPSLRSPLLILEHKAGCSAEARLDAQLVAHGKTRGSLTYEVERVGGSEEGA